MNKRTSLILGSLVAAGMALTSALPASAVDPVIGQPAAVQTMSGSHSCSDGKKVSITALANSGNVSIYINGKYKTGSSIVAVSKTGLTSASWKVTGTNLASVSEGCYGFGGGGGGNF